jgi:DNA-binding response OmpR family regulator
MVGKEGGMRAHILSTSREIGEMLRAGLELEGGQHHVTVDAEVSTADRPIPLDVDLLVADLDNPCMPATRMVRQLEVHPARQHARVILLSSRCHTARRLEHRYQWATVVHSLHDVLRVHDVWLEMLQADGGPRHDN